MVLAVTYHIALYWTRRWRERITVYKYALQRLDQITYTSLVRSGEWISQGNEKWKLVCTFLKRCFDTLGPNIHHLVRSFRVWLRQWAIFFFLEKFWLILTPLLNFHKSSSFHHVIELETKTTIVGGHVDLSFCTDVGAWPGFYVSEPRRSFCLSFKCRGIYEGWPSHVLKELVAFITSTFLGLCMLHAFLPFRHTLILYTCINAFLSLFAYNISIVVIFLSRFLKSFPLMCLYGNTNVECKVVEVVIFLK